MDRKGRSLQLSIKAKDEAETAETLAEYSKASSSSDASSGTTKLGALLREQLENKSEYAVLRWPGFGRAADLPATTLTVSLTKSELIELLTHRQRQLKTEHVDMAAHSFLEMMGGALATRERIQPPGFGSFS